MQTVNARKFVFDEYPGLRFKIVNTSKAELVFQNDDLVDDRIFMLPREQFNNMLQNKMAKEYAEPVPLNTALKEYQEKHIKKYLPFMEIMMALKEQGISPTSTKTYPLICQKMDELHPRYEYKYPKRSALSAKFSLYSHNNQYLASSLLGKKRKPRNLIAEEEQEFLESFLHYCWAAAHDANKQSVFNTYLEHAQQAGLKGASQAKFYRYISKIKDMEQQYLSSSESEQNKILRTRISKIKVTAPFERCEADRIVVNIMLLNEDGSLIKGKLSFYFIIDCYTRCIIAWTYEFGKPESLKGVVNLLTEAHKTSEFNPYAGRIRELFVDNGPGFEPEELTLICNRNGISLTRVAANSPFKKPFIESFMRLFRKKFFEGYRNTVAETGELIFGIPGYAGRGPNGLPQNRGKSVEDSAAFTHSQFHEAFCDFLDQYHNEKRTVLNGKTPDQAMNDPELLFPTYSIPYEDIRTTFHYVREHRTLNEKGIVRLDNQDFSSFELKQMYFEFKPRGSKKLQVEVAYNPADATSITVSICENGIAMRTIEVPNSDREHFEKDSPSFAELNKNRFKQSGYWHASSEIKSLVKRNKKERSPGGLEIPNAADLDDQEVSASERIDKSNQALKTSRKRIQKIEDDKKPSVNYYDDESKRF